MMFSVLRRFTGPSMFMGPGARGVLRTRFDEGVTREGRAALMEMLPIKSFVFHTVSSGRNLVWLMPSLQNQPRMRATQGKGYGARSASRTRTVYLRHDQCLVLTYGASRDHEAFMQPLFHVRPEDWPLLDAFGADLWDMQLRGESKIPLTFTLAGGATERPPDGAAGAPLLRDPPTGNPVVDKAAGDLRAETKKYWSNPPAELVHFLSIGDARGLEGTDGFTYPPMVIANGSLMTLCSYAHSGVLNTLAARFERGIAEEQLPVLKSHIQDVAGETLPYLRALSLEVVCDGFHTFLSALEQADTVLEVRTLLSAISLFGTVMHGHLVSLFPYRVGMDFRRRHVDETVLHSNRSYQGGRSLGATTTRN